MKHFKLLLLVLIIGFSGCKDNEKITFIALGDWGREGKINQRETGWQMDKWAGKNYCDFVISTGDNFYEMGIKSNTDSLLKKSFENIYTGDNLQIPWYATLGNHDYGGSVYAQIDYTKFSKRWKMPERTYSFEQEIPGKYKVLFVMIDTNPFIEDYQKNPEKHEEISAESIEQFKKIDIDKQVKWIDSTLAGSNAKWKFVVGHHPLYSGGKHGNEQDLINKLKPIFDKNKIKFYICGHDHDLQYLKDGDVNYFVSGAGSELRETKNIDKTLFAKSVNGFVGFTISQESVKFQFVDLDGNILYESEVK